MENFKILLNSLPVAENYTKDSAPIPVHYNLGKMLRSKAYGCAYTQRISTEGLGDYQEVGKLSLQCQKILNKAVGVVFFAHLHNFIKIFHKTPFLLT